MSQLPTLLARQLMRRHSRKLIQNNEDVSTHLARLNAALDLPGSEPVQGALADIFASFGVTQGGLKRAALQLAKDRLSAHVINWFDSHVNGPMLPRITPLATRWSILSIPSADMSTRARRCSADDSRALAEQVVKAVAQQDEHGQVAFLHHCLTCHDNLAFMLARRALLRIDKNLPPGWDAVSRQLEQSQTS
jgi:hypothetical protein